jgi:hypothetical protein
MRLGRRSSSSDLVNLRSAIRFRLKMEFSNHMPANTETLFIRACSSDDTENVRRLLQEGVVPDTTDRNGLTGLILAARKGRIEIAKLLLEAGARLEAKDQRGRTAFFHAVALNKYGLVQQLAEAGAEINPIDAHGWTPLDVARAQQKMVALLAELGGHWAHYDGPPKVPIEGTNTFLFGCGGIGGNIPSTVDDEQRQLQFLMDGWTGCYTDAVAKFAFRPYVDGSVIRFTEQMGILGAQKATRSKDWLTVKIGIPENWWQPDRTAHKKHLTDAVEHGFNLMIALLRRNRHPIDAESLLRDWQTIKQLFFAVSALPAGSKGRTAALLALQKDAAAAVAVNKKRREP